MAGDVVIDLIRQGIKTREDIVSNFARTTAVSYTHLTLPTKA